MKRLHLLTTVPVALLGLILPSLPTASAATDGGQNTITFDSSNISRDGLDCLWQLSSEKPVRLVAGCYLVKDGRIQNALSTVVCGDYPSGPVALRFSAVVEGGMIDMEFNGVKGVIGGLKGAEMLRLFSAAPGQLGFSGYENAVLTPVPLFESAPLEIGKYVDVLRIDVESAGRIAAEVYCSLRPATEEDDDNRFAPPSVAKWRGEMAAAEEALSAAGPLPKAPDATTEAFAGGNKNMRYFLIPQRPAAEAPEKGFGLLVVMPGGGGGADFRPFVENIAKNALPDGYLVAELVAVKWSDDQQIIWPTRTNLVQGAKFTTEDFVEAVVKEVGAGYKLDQRRIFTLSWSSSGPAACAVSLQEKTAVTGSFVAMSVFKPDTLPPLAAAKGRAYYIYHSPEDLVCPIRMARAARDALSAAGATVTFVEYPGGHGWRLESAFADIRKGIDWLEKAVGGERMGEPAR